MNHLANALRQSAIMLSPVLLSSTKELFKQLGLKEELTKWDSINAFDALGGQTVTKGDNLFPRLKAEDEVTYIKNLMGGNN
jgi:methionyl-tRNA synthetase